MSEKIAVIGSGLIGRAWAISFARAGFQVDMTDKDPGTLQQAVQILKGSIEDLADNGLLGGQGVDEVWPDQDP